MYIPTVQVHMYMYEGLPPLHIKDAHAKIARWLSILRIFSEKWGWAFANELTQIIFSEIKKASVTLVRMHINLYENAPRAATYSSAGHNRSRLITQRQKVECH